MSIRIRPEHAKRAMIEPRFFAMAEIDPAKVDALIEHIRGGGKVPPVVVAKYGPEHMPLDGHHRMAAFRRLERQVDAWVVKGDRFDFLCMKCADAGTGSGETAEAHVLCGGVPAMQVASKWSPE